jgi:flagellar basal body-associated protein FliL
LLCLAVAAIPAEALLLLFQEVTRAKYAADMKFQDPVVSYASLDGFVFNIKALRTAFKVTLNLHSVDINGPEEVRTRYPFLPDKLASWLPAHQVLITCSSCEGGQ